jgi:hypothetical protein
MTCRKYENALLLAACHDRPDVKLARHLEHCPTCRMTLQENAELFRRIDSTLRVQVNEDPPAAYLAQLRLQVSKEATPQGGPRLTWHVAGAAFAVILFAALYPLLKTRQSSLQVSAAAATIEVAQNAGVKQSVHVSEHNTIRSRPHSNRRVLRRAVRQQPEVLVPGDEQQAFDRFVACVARRDAMTQAVVRPAQNKTFSRTTDLPQVAFIAIADLEFRAGKEEFVGWTGSSE